jgi:hypothetical protein
MAKKKRKRCIPIYRPHSWHIYYENKKTGWLSLQCSRCKKIKVLS